jgi:hypothetical protein
MVKLKNRLIRAKSSMLCKNNRRVEDRGQRVEGRG